MNLTDEDWFTLNTKEFAPPEIDLPQTNQMLKVFPEARSIVKRLIKECNSELNHLLKREQMIDAHRWDMSYDHYWFMKGVIALFPRMRIEEIKDRFNKQLKWVEYKPTKGAEKSIEELKTIPISEFLEFRNGFAHCIWHDEKSPSMKYYPKDNRVHCFSCSKGGDVLDVVQKLMGKSLPEAIRYLSTH